MATRVNRELEPYEKLENMVMERIYELENENTQLKNDLTIAQAKLEVYERLANISDTKTTLGFGPPLNREGGV